MQSSNLVNCTIKSPIIFVICTHSSPTSSSGSNSNRVESSLVLLQLGPLGFILIGSPSPPMAHQHARSLTRYP